MAGPNPDTGRRGAGLHYVGRFPADFWERHAVEDERLRLRRDRRPRIDPGDSPAVQGRRSGRSCARLRSTGRIAIRSHLVQRPGALGAATGDRGAADAATPRRPLAVGPSASRVTQDEVRAAVRAAGLASLGEAEAVVLETDGSFSVIRRGEGSSRSSLDGVRGPRGDGPTACP